VLVRQPSFDFTDLAPVWSDNAELAMSINAQGLVPAYIEPFLIKVMRRAKAELDPVSDAALIADIDVFNKQEAQHFKFHQAFNRVVRENAYEGMSEYERRYEAEYDDMLATKSLKWLVAYCEGFESMGLQSAPGWVDGTMASQLPNADPRAIALWRWHLAEEYEHRTVAFNLLKTLYGKNPVTFYFLRLTGFFNAAKHIGGNVARLQGYLLRTYREREGVEAPEPAKGSRLAPLKQLTRFLGVASPLYDPAKAPKPAGLDEVLASVA
jgi:uncharacterized protein